MRVAYVCADAGVPIFGNKGCSIHVQEIVRAFLQRGDQVDIFAARTGGTPATDLAQCKVEKFRCPPITSVAMRERAQQEVAEQIAKRIKFDQYDLLYERYSLWSKSCQQLSRAHDLLSVLEINAPLIEEQIRHRELADVAGARRIAAMAFSNATTRVSVSQEVRDYVKDFLNHESDPREGDLIVASNGVDIARFSPETMPLSRSSRLTIGFVGTLKPWHGVESLLLAFHRFLEHYPTAELRIIGDGPMLPELTILARSLSPLVAAQTHFVGSVSPSAMPQHLAAFDIAVAPYMCHDNFYFSPLKVFEYMAMGLPVVASQTGQLRDVISSGENGILYEPGNVAELTSQLLKLAQSQTLRNQLGLSARQTVCRHHSWSTVLDTILKHTFRSQQSVLAGQG